MNRDSYWRWLLLGLKGLAVMIEQAASDRDNRPTGEQAKQLAELSERLTAVTVKFETGST